MNVDKIIDEIVSSKQIWYSSSTVTEQVIDVNLSNDTNGKCSATFNSKYTIFSNHDLLSFSDMPEANALIVSLLDDGHLIVYHCEENNTHKWRHFSLTGTTRKFSEHNLANSNFTLDKFWLATEEFTRDYAYVISIRPSLLLAPALVCAIEMFDNKTFTLREVRESTLQLPQTSLPRYYVKYIAGVMFGITYLTKDDKVGHVFDTVSRDFYTLSALNDSIKLALLSNNCEYIWDKHISAECKDSIHEYISKFVPSNN